MDPIALTTSGLNILIPHPCAKDETKLDSLAFLGTHESCGGNIELVSVSPSRNTTLCMKCSLGAIISKEIDTFSKLRQWSEQQAKTPQARKLAEIISDARSDRN